MREEYRSLPVDTAHHQERIHHGEAVLESGEGGVQQLFLLKQFTTRRESSMVRLFLRVEREEYNSYLLMQLTTRRESSMVSLFLRVEWEE